MVKNMIGISIGFIKQLFSNVLTRVECEIYLMEIGVQHSAQHAVLRDAQLTDKMQSRLQLQTTESAFKNVKSCGELTISC